MISANFLHPYHSDYPGHSLAKGNFDETKMVSCRAKTCSNQSRLNKISGKEKKEIKDAWIRTIARPVLPAHACSDNLTEDSFDESQ